MQQFMGINFMIVCNYRLVTIKVLFFIEKKRGIRYNW